MPRSGGGKGGKGVEEDMDATKTGEAFDPRTLDLKARDNAIYICLISRREIHSACACLLDVKIATLRYNKRRTWTMSSNLYLLLTTYYLLLTTYTYY